jgi:hypothetical protein
MRDYYICYPPHAGKRTKLRILTYVFNSDSIYWPKFHLITTFILSEISGFHDRENEDGCLLVVAP